MLAITLASFFIPGGMVRSIAKWFSKGHSLCVWGGCLKPADKTVSYQAQRESIDIGYCAEHFDSASKTLTSERHGKSLSGLLIAIFAIGPVFFALWYYLAIANALDSKPNSMRNFVWMCVALILPWNVLSYFFWMHLEWTLRAAGR